MIKSSEKVKEEFAGSLTAAMKSVGASGSATFDLVSFLNNTDVSFTS